MNNLKASLRKVAVKILYHLNIGDVAITHPYTKQKMTIHSFRHKGYWFHGKHREESSMKTFAEWIKPGDIVVEAGGHVGFISVYFSSLVGRNGKIIVFEPGSNNLPYLEKNVSRLPNVEVIKMAISNFCGPTEFLLENLTGQNNSLLKNYEIFSNNVKAAGVRVETHVETVQCTTLDTYWCDETALPDFIKIDIEGAELAALEGAKRLLSPRLHEAAPRLMVEVTNQNEAVFVLLNSLGYSIRRDDGVDIGPENTPSGNWFCIHPSDHEHDRLLSKLIGGRTIPAHQ